MDANERERFYDETIAPQLLALAAQCEERGLSFLAVVEWAPGETGRTATLTREAGVEIRMAEVAARCRGNVDAFVIALGNSDLARRGHGSVALSLMGFPAEPLPTPPEASPAEPE